MLKRCARWALSPAGRVAEYAAAPGNSPVVVTSTARLAATLRAAMAISVTPAPARSASRQEHQRRGPAVGRVLVLNATFEPVNVCTVRRAVVLLLKDKAEVIEHAEWELHSATTSMARQVVLRLVRYVQMPT